LISFSARQVLHLLADTLDPLLALLALLHPAMRPPLGDRRTVRLYFLTTALGLAGIYAVAAVDALFSIWGRWGLDYSTHTAFAVSLAISIGLARPRWGWAVGIVILAHSTLIVALGFHGLADVVTSGLVAALVTVPWHCVGRRPWR
jgi:hypothetical protein